MAKTPKDEFIELMYEIQRAKGLDELSSKLIGILFIEPHEISLDELKERTGYSLSAVCSAMKFLERVGIANRSKKPGSRKVYFYMKKDMPSMLTEIVKKLENNVLMLKSRIPGIIERYKMEKSKSSKEELKIVEDYYKKLLNFEGMMKKMVEMIEITYPESRRKI
jgi:DNA-binding transcriptional regulator GbsR (MarR family)